MFIWFRYECTYEPSSWATFRPFLLCVGGYDDLLFSLVGLNLDFSEWVKLGVMDEAERLDRHWASWTNFTQASAFCIRALRSFIHLLSPSTGCLLVPLRWKRLLCCRSNRRKGDTLAPHRPWVRRNGMVLSSGENCATTQPPNKNIWGVMQALNDRTSCYGRYVSSRRESWVYTIDQDIFGC